jgi:hypothetical protein
VRRRIILAVTIAAALFGLVAAPALAQNSESAPAAAALMKSKPKTPLGRSRFGLVSLWSGARQAVNKGAGQVSYTWTASFSTLPRTRRGLRGSSSSSGGGRGR